MMNEDSDQGRYCTKMDTLLSRKNFDGFASQLIVSPNFVLSLMPDQLPILYTIGISRSVKTAKLLFSAIRHFEYCLLGKEQIESKQVKAHAQVESNGNNNDESCNFMKKYLNYIPNTCESRIFVCVPLQLLLIAVFIAVLNFLFLLLLLLFVCLFVCFDVVGFCTAIPRNSFKKQ